MHFVAPVDERPELIVELDRLPLDVAGTVNEILFDPVANQWSKRRVQLPRSTS